MDIKEVLIYGHGRSASVVREKIKAFPEEFRFCAYLTEEKDRDCVDMEFLENHANEKLTVIVPNPGKQTPEVLKMLKGAGIKNIYFVPAAELRKEKNSREQFLIPVTSEKPWLMGFEFHAADHCNLNCKGCGHCANLFSESFPSSESYRRDLLRISELFAGVGLVRIMGGEPLLNPELPGLIRMTREILQTSEIHIVTNGLLLERMPEEFYRMLRETFTLVDISLYPPVKNQKEQIEKMLLRAGLQYHITEADEFYRRFTLEEGSDKNEVFRKCSTRTCHCLRDGKISACIVPFSTEILNRVYGLHIPVDGWIDLYEEGITGDEINQRLDLPLELCSHCRKEKEFFKWGTRQRKDARLEDWIVGGEKDGEGQSFTECQEISGRT